MADVINFIANSLTITVLVGYLFVLWGAVVIWTWFDVSSRTGNPLFRLGAILLVATGAILGFAIYLLLRPASTLEEAQTREIEETILASQSQFLTCPACHYTAHEDFVYCPNCSLRLLSECGSCGKQINISWSTCPYCGKERKTMVEIEPEIKPEEVPAPVVAVSAKKGPSLAFFSALSGFLKRRNVKKRPKRSKTRESTFGPPASSSPARKDSVSGGRSEVGRGKSKKGPRKTQRSKS